MAFSSTLKQSILEQITNRESESISSVCLRNNISTGTVHSWLSILKKQNSVEANDMSKTLTVEERFNLILEYSSCTEKEQGILLRKRGLFTTDIDTLKKDMLMTSKKEANTISKNKDLKKENLLLQKRIKEQDSVIRKKDKVIAETTALLVLKKKLENLIN